MDKYQNLITDLRETNPDAASEVQALLEQVNQIARANDFKSPWKKLVQAKQSKKYDVASLTGILRDFGVEGEYQKLDPDPEQVSAFAQFTKDLRAQVKKYLRPLPDKPQYHFLRLHQDVVRRNFKLEEFLERPSRIDGPFMAAFTEYKNLFVNTFVQECAAQKDVADDFWARKKQIAKELQALAILEKLPHVHDKFCGDLETRFAELQKAVPRCTGKPGSAACSQEVEASAGCPHFQLGECCRPGIQKFETDRRKAIARHISEIKEAGVDKLLAKSQKDEIQKLLSLLQLEQIDNIINLLATRKGEQISLELAKLIK